MALAAQAPASGPRDRLIVTTAWLAEHLGDANLVLLHFGERPDYDAGHIPGARFISLDDVSLPRDASPDGLTLQLPPIEQLLSKLEALGISDESRIVIYNANTSITQATRIFHALDYAGLGDRTSILNGGVQAWKREGRPMTTEPAPDRRGKLAARPARNNVVALDWVIQHVRTPVAGHVLVDGRTTAFYEGAQESMGRKGHIPSAASVPYSELTAEDLTFKGDAELRALFDRAGINAGDVVVAYCHIGQQASAVLFAARLLGHEVRLFDGSMQEWAKDASRPVTVGAERGR